MRKYISVVMGLILALSATPAYSHDTLVDISPAPGEVLFSTSFEAVLTFDNPLLVIDSQTNAEFATRPSGSTDWQTHPITIVDRTLTAQVQLAESGSYDLLWKVVSSDGHPITGESSFAVDQASSESEQEPAVMAYQTDAGAESGDIPAGFYIGLLMVALGAVFAPIGLMMRRKSKKS